LGCGLYASTTSMIVFKISGMSLVFMPSTSHK
jgi:hypothetical protein